MPTADELKQQEEILKRIQDLYRKIYGEDIPIAKLERLKNGETFVTKETGNSMVPLIKSKQDHVLAPVLIEDVVPGDIVYCKVKGNWYTHLVKAIDPLKGCLIGNNKGNINGWTKQVYGKVIEVL
jgi:hypothetical protein